MGSKGQSPTATSFLIPVLERQRAKGPYSKDLLALGLPLASRDHGEKECTWKSHQGEPSDI